MRILFCTGSAGRYMAPPRLADEQIVAGPDWLDSEVGGHVLTLNTPLGEYDLGAVVARLPSDQQPDAVVCLVDAAWRSVPRNLRSFRGAKVLLVADTHHLNTPISGMTRYALAEGFDRVVLLYDRHHLAFFQAAGVRGLHWFPGLTFPHEDHWVRSARGEVREKRVAFVGQTGICHPRRALLLSALRARQVPLEARSLPQAEAMAFYGSSLVGFNNSLNGDLNLRVFEVLASGAQLLTDRLAPDSGLGDILGEGTQFVAYGSAEELAERAAEAVVNPDRARAVGEAGARWFDANFSAEKRRAAFAKLVADGAPHPLFVLPGPVRISGAASTLGHAHRQRLILAYELIQEIHRNLDRVVVVADESVPDDVIEACATLPRLELRRGPLTQGARADFLIIGKGNLNHMALAVANRVWCWEELDKERVAFVRRCSSMGLSLNHPELLLFSRQRVNSHQNDGAIALTTVEFGSYDDALPLAKRELDRNPRSVDALLALTDIAWEKGREDVARSFLRQLQLVAPHHPRVAELSAPPPRPHGRRPARLANVARTLLDQQKWTDAAKIARDILAIDPKSADAHFVLGVAAAHGPEPASAASLLGRAAELAPERLEIWKELARCLRRIGRTLDALSAWIHVVEQEPAEFESHLALADSALATGHGHLAVAALENAAQLRPNSTVVSRWMVRALELRGQVDVVAPRDLLLSHVEVTRLQGTGVLLERFFPDAANFITIRSRTLYSGKVDFGGIHFSVDVPGLGEVDRRRIVARLLSPFRIQRILCVPFFPSDFMHALAAREASGAPLCTYVMDDQIVHGGDVPSELADRVFRCSDLRLAISPEMVECYGSWFQRPFGLLPPLVTRTENEVPNAWNPATMPATRCAMVGNIWSAKQFEQVRAFSRAAGLQVDWFGNSKVSWLPQDPAELSADGIHCRGFLAEDQLARRLAEYPFVLLPSGMLDGSEDNEWLTRLSLPSRMVFILTRTFTPMLVLGSEETAAARFVQQFGLGLSSNYDAAEAAGKIRAITSPEDREVFLGNARRAATAFLLPDAGEWLWNSLAAKSPRPTPFDALYAPVLAGLPPPTAGGEADGLTFERELPEIVAKLGNAALMDTYLEADEPRQRADIRPYVRFLHSWLGKWRGLHVKLLTAAVLARRTRNHRAVLVVWAELLERAGQRAAAAAKARQALSLYYDDVYTQTLFVRCAGEQNFHADAADRFCPHPFENFEIYKDGAVFPCNCTQVPFPIGNALTQTAEEIWQSPQAKAIRQSVLDGSFRFCSPMTCWQRFNLPKRSEQPERFAELQRIGVDGVAKPKHLNLSYDLSCNLSCPSCRNAPIMARQDERQKLEHIRDQIVLPLLQEQRAESVYITGSGDAFGSPHFRSVLKELCNPKYRHVEITLGTNGQLITPRLWEEFQPLHERFRDITISIDGARPETYERLRRGSTWEKLLRTMEVLAAARRAGKIRRIMVNMVVQEQNFREMPELIRLCLGWAVDGIRFYRIRQWGNVHPAAFMGSDIANPLHPKHPELMELLADSIFRNPIVDHYDMYALILVAQRGGAAHPVEVPALEPALQS